MGKGLKVDMSTVHVIIRCQDCDWQTEDYKTGEAAAAEHALKEGHKVTGEVGIYAQWTGLKT